MTDRRVRARLGPVALAAVLLTACGTSDGDSDGDAGPSASSSTSGSAGPTTTPVPAGTPPTDGDGSADAPPFPANADPDTGAASAGAAVTITDIRTGGQDGFDRVVLDVAGTGVPGWDVRYVPTAVEQGRGEAIPVEGAAILQVTITGTRYPADTGVQEYDGSQPLPGSGTEVVTEVVWDSTFEGTSVAFVGTTQQTPFRVYLLTGPTRVVVDVVHPGG